MREGDEHLVSPPLLEPEQYTLYLNGWKRDRETSGIPKQSCRYTRLSTGYENYVSGLKSEQE